MTEQEKKQVWKAAKKETDTDTVQQKYFKIRFPSTLRQE